MNFNYADYFERRTELCGGALVVKGTRAPMRTLLASLAEGASDAEVLADFPTVALVGMLALRDCRSNTANEIFGMLTRINRSQIPNRALSPRSRHKAFLDLHKKLQQEQPELFRDNNWPIFIADEVARTLTSQ